MKFISFEVLPTIHRDMFDAQFGESCFVNENFLCADKENVVADVGFIFLIVAI